MQICSLLAFCTLPWLSPWTVHESWSTHQLTPMQVTIAKAIEWRFTVWLCVFGVLGLIPFASVRAHNNPPVAKSVGKSACLNEPYDHCAMPCARSDSVRFPRVSNECN